MVLRILPVAAFCFALVRSFKVDRCSAINLRLAEAASYLLLGAELALGLAFSEGAVVPREGNCCNFSASELLPTWGLVSLEFNYLLD